MSNSHTERNPRGLGTAEPEYLYSGRQENINQKIPLANNTPILPSSPNITHNHLEERME